MKCFCLRDLDIVEGFEIFGMFGTLVCRFWNEIEFYYL